MAPECFDGRPPHGDLRRAQSGEAEKDEPIKINTG